MVKRSIFYILIFLFICTLFIFGITGVFANSKTYGVSITKDESNIYEEKSIGLTKSVTR